MIAGARQFRISALTHILLRDQVGLCIIILRFVTLNVLMTLLYLIIPPICSEFLGQLNTLKLTQYMEQILSKLFLSISSISIIALHLVAVCAFIF